MAAGAWKVYGAAIQSVANGAIDLDTNTFRMVLVTSSYTPNQSTHDQWDDISANEVANGNGYTTHGKILTPSVTRSGLETRFDVDDQSWTSSTITAKYAVIVKDADANGSLAATDAVIAYCDLNDGGGSVSTTNGTLAITIDAEGVFEFVNQ